MIKGCFSTSLENIQYPLFFEDKESFNGRKVISGRWLGDWMYFTDVVEVEGNKGLKYTSSVFMCEIFDVNFERVVLDG